MDGDFSDKGAQACGEGSLRFSDSTPGRFRLRLLALAPLLATVLLCPSMSSVLQGFSSIEGTASAYMTSLYAMGLAGSLALALASAANPSWSGFGVKGVAVFAAVYIIAAVSFSLAISFSCQSVLLFLVLGGLAGASLVPLGVEWVACFSMGLRSIMLNGALAFAVASMLVWLISLCPIEIALIVFSVCAFVGGFGTLILAFRLRRCLGEGERQSGLPQAAAPFASPQGIARSFETVLSLMWMPLLGSFIWVFSSTMVKHDDATVDFVCALCAAALALLLCFIKPRTSLAVLVGRVVVPLCVAACVVLNSLPPTSGSSALVGPMVGVPLIFVSIFVACSLVVVASSGEFPRPFVFGSVMALQSLAILLAMGLQSVFEYYGIDNTDILKVLVNAYFAAVLASLVYTSWKQLVSTKAESGWGASVVPEVVEEAFRARLDALSSEAGLTDRERELLFYLARGHSSTYIAKTLFISSNTVKTHTRHIYRKLGVGSRDELLARLSEPVS